jgi:transcriptional regulator GlxA family with amidase domain
MSRRRNADAWAKSDCSAFKQERGKTDYTDIQLFGEGVVVRATLHETGKARLFEEFGGKISGDRRIRVTQIWIMQHLTFAHTVAALAGRANMSVRNFTRTFRNETKMTPRNFVELARVKAAARILEESEVPLKRIAVCSGFISVNVMRAAFKRWAGIGPHLYRCEMRAKVRQGDGGVNHISR